MEINEYMSTNIPPERIFMSKVFRNLIFAVEGGWRKSEIQVFVEK